MTGAVITDERAALTGLRGVAVAIVVVSHLGNGSLHPIPGLQLNAIGKSGVWLFFSLSAFLLTSHLALRLSNVDRAHWREIGAYAVNRFFRIYPLYILVLIAHAAWGDMTPAGILRHLLLLEGLNELWAIPVEFKYYLVIPIVALMSVRVGVRGTAAVLAAVMVAALVASAAWPGKVFSNDLDLVYRLPPFLAGSGLALTLPAKQRRFVGSALFAVFALGAGAMSVFAYRTVILDGTLVGFSPAVSLLLAVACVMLLSGSVNESSRLAQLLSRRPIMALGKISFGVYLWHLFPIRWLMQGATMPGWAVAWLAIAATLVIAAITYYAVERPGILLGRRVGKAVFGGR